MSERREPTLLINGKNANPEQEAGRGLQQEETAAAVYLEAGAGWEMIQAEDSAQRRESLIRRFVRLPLLQRRAARRRLLLPLRPKTAKLLSKQLAGAVLAAVLIGCVFGVVFLMLFTGEKAESQRTHLQSNLPAAAPAKIKNVSLRFNVVQNGLFAELAKAEEAAKELRNKGRAAVVSKQGASYAVLIGIGNTKEQAAMLAGRYTLEGIDTWPRKLESDYSNLHVPQKTDESFILNGKILLQNLFTLAQAATLDAKTKEALRKDFDTWKTYGNRQLDHWPAEQKAAISSYEKKVSLALAALREGKPAKNDWKMQQAALDCFVAYETLLRSLK